MIGMICPKCGNSCPDGSELCPVCSSQMPVVARTVTEADLPEGNLLIERARAVARRFFKNKSVRRKVLFALATVAVMIALVLCVWDIVVYGVACGDSVDYVGTWVYYGSYRDGYDEDDFIFEFTRRQELVQYGTTVGAYSVGEDELSVTLNNIIYTSTDDPDSDELILVSGNRNLRLVRVSRRTGLSERILKRLY